MNWASKASCNQRSGRAGRCGEGFVFRLIPENFYDCLNPFSSPELLRIPLEKLILRIKLWEHAEPVIVLGRAIQPPQLNRIEQAINNLRNNGALTEATNETASGNLTPLGRVFAELPIDIKYSRLIMLSFAFDLIEPGIIIASILSQDKSLIRIDDVGLNELLFIRETDRGCNSDLLMLFNFYKLWEANFPNENENEFSRFRKLDRSLYSQEYKWCRDHHSKPIILKEVQMLVADLKKRLNNLDIYHPDQVRKINYFCKEESKQIKQEDMFSFDFTEQKSEEQNLNEFMDILNPVSKSKENPGQLLSESESDMKREDLFFIKIAIAGAFHGKYIRCGYKSIDKIRKIQKSKNACSQLRSVKVKSIPPDADENFLIEYFKRFGRINHHSLNSDEMLLEFSDEAEETEDSQCNSKIEKTLQSIRNLLAVTKHSKEFNDIYEKYKRKVTGRHHRHDRNLIDMQPVIKLRPEYLYEIRFNELFSFSEILISSQSVNSELIEIREENLSRKFLVCDEVHTRNNQSSITKRTTLMPESDMGYYILVMIFSPNVRFFPNASRTGYCGFKVQGSEIEFRFMHLFSSVDVDEINIIRKYFNKIVSNASKLSYLVELRRLIKRKIIDLWNKKRVKIINNEDWWRIFYYFNPDEKESNYLRSYTRNDSDDSRLLELEKSLLLPNEHDKNRLEKDNSNIKTNKDEFLPMLERLDINEDFRLWSQDGIRALMSEREKFHEMKFQVENSLNRKKEMCSVKSAHLVCELCNEYITELKCLKLEKNRIFSINGYLSGFISKIPFDAEKVQIRKSSDKNGDVLVVREDAFVKFYYERITKQDPLNWIACKNNFHIFGFEIASGYYTCFPAKMSIYFPTLPYETFNWNLPEALRKENFYCEKRNEEIVDILCEVCNQVIHSDDDFLKHLKTQKHSGIVTELMEECFTMDSNVNN